MSHLRRAITNVSRNLRSSTIIYRRTKSTNTKKLTSIDQYNNEKQAAKERRTNLYRSKINRRQSLPNRQDAARKNHKKQVFRSWYDALASKQAFLDREARRQNKKFKIRVAAMVERLPVVTPDREDWESEFWNLKAELARYDGINYPKELGFVDPLDRKVFSEEELLDMLPEGFTPAPRETEADKSGDIQTLDRQLKTRVYLTIENIQNDDKGIAKASLNSNGWQLPSVTLDENETMLEGAKRAIKLIAGESLTLRCFSNCPMGVDVVEYTEEEKQQHGGTYFGEKTFYMRVQHEDGDVKKNTMDDKFEDWGWLSREEMTKKVVDKKGEEAAMFYKYML